MAVFLHQCLTDFVPQTGPLTRASLACPTGDYIRPRAPYAILAPGAGSAAKRAPLSFFEAAARDMHAKGTSPVFLAGEVEKATGLATLYPEWYQRIDTPSLVELAGLLQGADAVYANDSGPAHLAGLLGAPTTIFFGPTDPLVWQPWGPRITVRPF